MDITPSKDVSLEDEQNPDQAMKRPDTVSHDHHGTARSNPSVCQSSICLPDGNIASISTEQHQATEGQRKTYGRTETPTTQSHSDSTRVDLSGTCSQEKANDKRIEEANNKRLDLIFSNVKTLGHFKRPERLNISSATIDTKFDDEAEFDAMINRSCKEAMDEEVDRVFAVFDQEARSKRTRRARSCGHRNAVWTAEQEELLIKGKMEDKLTYPQIKEKYLPERTTDGLAQHWKAMKDQGHIE